MTSNNSCIHVYEDIAPFPIGGVKADDLAIVCTGKGLLPWLSIEGKITIVEILYCEKVEGTIILPTTIVRQYIHLYQGFTVIANVDDETGVLKKLKRNGVHHASYVMMLVNNPWYHEFIPQSTTFAKVNKLNDACLSNLWNGKLAHAGQGVMRDIHKHVIVIDKPIKHNPSTNVDHASPVK